MAGSGPGRARTKLLGIGAPYPALNTEREREKREQERRERKGEMEGRGTTTWWCSPEHRRRGGRPRVATEGMDRAERLHGTSAAAGADEDGCRSFCS